ncbi:MAG: hypothetical protein AB1757_22225 [Acidobacteriota bacterium]
MAVSLQPSNSAEITVVAGNKLMLRIRASDPAGIQKIYVQCFQFSVSNTSKAKFAYGEVHIPPEAIYQYSLFEIPVEIPENAALGKWGIQTIEFTNGRGHRTAFYRGQSKFDNITFDVVSPPTKEDELLKFSGVEIANWNDESSLTLNHNS